MQHHRKIILILACIGIGLLAWAPWLTTAQVRDITTANAAILAQHSDSSPQYLSENLNIHWIPFGRAISSYEGIWFVWFWQGFRSLQIPAHYSNLSLLEVVQQHSEKLYGESVTNGIPACSDMIQHKIILESDVYGIVAAQNCASVTKEQNNLYYVSATVGAKNYLKVQWNKRMGWSVLESEESISPNLPLHNEWAKQIDQTLITKREPDIFWLHNLLVRRATTKLDVRLPPDENIKYCSTNAACDAGQLCYKQKESYMTTQCLNTCATDLDCKTGYTCVQTCINGENSCPQSSKKVCFPGLRIR